MQANWSTLAADQFLQAAKTLAPTILAERERIEQSRELPTALVETLYGAGLFSLWLPTALGGPELAPVDFVRIIEAIARADGSVGWCVAVGACYSCFAGYLEESVAREIYGAGDTILAGTLNPTGRAVAVPGGYRVTGQWSYGSGIQHSNWILGNCVVIDGNTARTNLDGSPVIRLMIFPRSDVSVIDTWRVSGLRGTGSHDFRVDDLFVPEQRAIMGFGGTPTQPGRLYGLPFTIFSVSLVGVPLGLARASIDALTELAGNKRPMDSRQLLKDKPAIQAAIGRAEATLRAARAFLFEAVQAMWDAAATSAPSLEQRALVRLAITHVAAAAKQVTEMMFESGGGTALYEDGRLARCSRDAQALAQHIALTSNNYEFAGRVLLGMDSGMARF
jgi:alkylation response protein AidB-like acyl-CoA dehydrogenase